jgi:hypothetical protein
LTQNDLIDAVLSIKLAAKTRTGPKARRKARSPSGR